MQLPTIRGYGEYRSSNYGVNALEVSFPSGFTLFYSYDTVIAFWSGYGLRIRKNEWSTTTGKHLNWIDEDKNIRLEGAQFEALLAAELKVLGLSPSDPHEHLHEWTSAQQGEGNETVFFCKNCEKTLDSSGGIS